jgi:Zn-dependent protease with chaperone function
MADPGPFYPYAPSGVPADLAKPGLRYRVQVALVLLALIPFLLLYFALLAGALGLIVWAAWPLGASLPEAWQARLFLNALRISVILLAALLIAFLFKGFLKQGEGETSQNLEITEQEQPELFQFIRSLCQEIGCPLPPRVYLNHEVNAAVICRTSLLNLLVPPQKNLLLGLGLIDSLNLVEFKALLAHELGHFSQRTLRLDGYVWVAYQAIHNMVHARDRWDRWVIRGFDMPWVSVIAVPLYGLAELTRGLLKVAFRVLNAAHLALRRQMELNADLVAVSVTGSDAPVHLLLKSDFFQTCLQQCSQDLALAAEQGLFTRDLFFHQQRTGDRLRAASAESNPGQPPELPSDVTLSVAVFQPGDRSTLAMWADHPSPYDREQNAKRRYFRSPQDDRPARLLFRGPEAVHEQVTRQFYRICLNLEPDELLSDPESVQTIIDEEQSGAVFDPRYQGIYDNRFLELADYDQLVHDVSIQAPPSPDQLLSSLRELYPAELQSWVTDNWGRRTENDEPGRLCSIAKAGFLPKDLHYKQQKDQRYLARFDRAILALHSRLAEQLGRHQEFELRYRFHLELQRLHRLAWEQKAQVEGMLHYLQTHRQMQWEQLTEVEEALAQVRERVAEVFLQTCHVLLPPLKRLKAGEPLASLLAQPPDLPSLRSAASYTDLDFGPLVVFHGQLATVVEKFSRVQAKSLAGILSMQEELASQWCQQAGAVPQHVVQPAEGPGQLRK